MRITVNVDTGFLPHFTAEFLERYGRESAYVRATSDLLTLRLAATMQNKGLLKTEKTIALFASTQAVQILEALIKQLPEDALKTLWQDALGVLEVGAFERLVDASLGQGYFSRWALTLDNCLS